MRSGIEKRVVEAEGISNFYNFCDIYIKHFAFCDDHADLFAFDHCHLKRGRGVSKVERCQASGEKLQQQRHSLRNTKFACLHCNYDDDDHHDHDDDADDDDYDNNNV